MTNNEPEFSLRDVKDSDHQWLVDLHNDPKVLYNLTDPSPITLESHLNWWKNSIDGKKNIRKIFCVNGKRVGFCKFYSVDRNNHNCVLGADIHKEERGKGYSYQMWKLMLRYCFDYLELYRVSLTTASYNNIAIKIYKKLGFLEEGRMKMSLMRDEVFYDQICMYQINEDWKRDEQD